MEQIDEKIAPKWEEMAYGFSTDENKHDATQVGVVTTTWPQEREMYDWPDEVAKKLKMSKLQYKWVQEYMKTGNATQSIRDARGGEIKPADSTVGYAMKNNTRINMYIQETAMECAEIQFEQIIKNEKAPMAVRNDAIKDRLTRAGVWVQKDEDKGNMFVGNMTIQIDNWTL